MSWAIDEVAVVSARAGSAKAIRAQTTRLGKKRGIALSYQRRRRRVIQPSTARPRTMGAHHMPPPPATLQQPPPVVEKKHTPWLGLCIRHSRPLLGGQLSETPGMQLCVQICCSAVPVQSPDLQNCAYEQESPISPVGGSQKHLPASHF